MLGRHRIEHLAAQQVERCHVVEFDIVKGVGQDFCYPREPRLNVLDKKQLDSPVKDAGYGDEEPDDRNFLDESGGIGVRGKDAKQRRIEVKQEWRERPNRH